MSRKSLTESFEMMIDAELARRKASTGFHMVQPERMPVPDLDGPEWDKPYLLAQERDTVGFYISGHPLDDVRDLVTAGATTTVSRILTEEVSDGASVTLGGVVSFIESRNTRKGDMMATVTVEDYTGSLDCVFFPAAYRQVRQGLFCGTIVFIGGRVDHRDGGSQLIATSLSVPDLSHKEMNAQ